MSLRSHTHAKAFVQYIDCLGQNSLDNLRTNAFSGMQNFSEFMKQRKSNFAVLSQKQLLLYVHGNGSLIPPLVEEFGENSSRNG